MLFFKSFHIITLVVIISFFDKTLGRVRQLQLRKRQAYPDCIKSYLIARTSEAICQKNIHSLSDYNIESLKKMCDQTTGCLVVARKAYEEFNKEEVCPPESGIKSRYLLMQHITGLEKIICKKEGSSFCLNSIKNFVGSQIGSKRELDICENNCIKDIYETIGTGVVAVPEFVRSGVIRARLLCSKVPGKGSYCVNKLKKFNEEKSDKKKMDMFCNSLCIQKTLWKDQSEYEDNFNENDDINKIIANFTDSACLTYNKNRCGDLLLKIMKKKDSNGKYPFECSGLHYPRVFPISYNYTVCNKEVEEIIKEYGTCVHSLFSNKSGDWLDLYKEISRYAKSRRLQNYTIFDLEGDYGESYNKTYYIENLNWDWYQSNDRAVSSYIINSIAAHLGLTPSMISGQGFNEYSIIIKGLTKKQQKELDNDGSLALTMFSGKIDENALKDSSNPFKISAANNIIPNILTIFAALSLLILYLI